MQGIKEIVMTISEEVSPQQRIAVKMPAMRQTMTREDREAFSQALAAESGRRVREARLAYNWTLAELGERVGLTGAAIGNYESGARRFGDGEAKAFTELFGLCEAYWLALVDKREAEMLAAGRRADVETGKHRTAEIQAAIAALEKLQVP